MSNHPVRFNPKIIIIMRKFMEAVQAAVKSFNVRENNSGDVKRKLDAILKGVDGEYAQLCREISNIVQAISLYGACGMDTNELERDLKGTEERRDGLLNVIETINAAMKTL